MSKALGAVGTIAAAVALVATGVGAVAGAAVAVAGVKVGTIATIASATAAAANVGAQLTAPKPIARGSPAQLVIDIEPPRPYIVGQVMTGGVLRHDVAYGADVAKVPNPYRWQVRVLSGVGPIQGIVGEFFDFAPINTSFYGPFFAFVQNLGDRPQAAALVPPYGPAPGWGPSSRLSGCAHVGLNFLFDRDGEVFAAGLPIYTALCDGEKVYDPRQDSTYPGGSGPCRAGDESTYVYSRNPACHAVTYALGRFENGTRVFGLGQPVDTIDMAAIVDWANDCDANDWTVNMVLTEGGTGANLREQRVRNLDDICAAGGARWYQAGGMLSFDWHRPRIALATLTDDDILEAGGGTDAVQTVRDRMNGVRPQYVSPAHNWQQITAAEIVGSTYRAEDGGEKLTQVYPLNGVTNAAQAGELAAYAMADSRELGPMDLQAKAKWRFYRPGDCIEIDSSLAAYNGLAVINQRSLNPQTLAVSLSLKSETPGKHDFALGKVADPPPTPVLAQTPEERDTLAKAALTPRAVDVEFDDGRTAQQLQPGEAGATRNVPRGTYDAGTTYVRGDSVLFSGSAYQLIVASSTGNAPPDVARWALLANAGSGPAGADGLPGISVLVSNEAHTVPTAADGSGGDYSAAGGQMRLLRGDVVLTPTFSIAAATPATGWISIDAATGVYTVTDPGVDLATATIRASWAGVNYDRTYTLAKSKQGVTGPRLALVADNQAFTFTDGAANPGSQTITLTALVNNLSGTATWSTTPSVTLGGSGNTRTLSVANFGANRQVTVEATLGGITDRITLVRVDRDVSAGNVNRLPFTRFEGGRGWATFSPDITPAAPSLVLFEGRYYIRVLMPFTGDGQNAFLFNAPRIPVGPGERLSVSAFIDGFAVTGPQPGAWQFYWEYYDGAGNLLGASTTLLGGGVGNAPSTRLSAFSTVPAAARTAQLVLRIESDGAGIVQMAIMEPMVARATADQTAHPDYVPGPNAFDGATVGAPAGTLVGGVEASALVAQAATALANASTAITNAATAQATADGKVTTFFQNDPPSADGVGDLWIDTNDGNRLYRWSGSAWVEIRDAGIAQAINAAATAEAIADSKIVSFYQSSPPTAGAVGDLWIDTDDANKLYRWSGSAWVEARDAGIAVAQQQASDAAAAAAAAQSSANSANAAISNITADNILSRDEKPEIRKQRLTIEGPGAEYEVIAARGVAFGVDITTFVARFGDLITYLNTLDLDSATDTPISRSTFNTRFTDYFNARQAVLDGIAAEAAERATWASVTGSSRPEDNADVTATAQRSIVPQFPVIEIKQGEAGNSGNRTVTHTALRGTTALSGGTWSLPSENLGAGDASIDGSTGTVTLSGIVQSGAYSVRYTHTDGIPTDLPVNVTYVPTPPSAIVSAKRDRATSINGTLNNNDWQTIVALTINSAPTGRVDFGGFNGFSFLEPTNAAGTADFEARLLLDGTTTLTSVLSQRFVTGGALELVDLSQLFVGTYAVSAGNRTFAVQLRRTGGTGTLLSTNTAIEATIVAS